MGRVPRIQVENAIYYVATGGDNNEPIFKAEADNATYLDMLGRYKTQHKFKLFAYFLAPTNISLLLEPSPDVPISRIMHDLNSNYTKYFNRKYARSGHLFQERYRMTLIEKEPNLLNMTVYIHSRPKLLTPPCDIAGYRYTSYPTYIKEGAKQNGPDIGNEVKEVLIYLKGKSYREFVNAMMMDKLKEFDGELVKKTIIGSDKFVQQVKSKIKSEKLKPKEASHPEPAPKPGPEVEVKPIPLPEHISVPELESKPAPEIKPEPILMPEPPPEPAPELKSEPIPLPGPITETAPEPEPPPQPKPEPAPPVLEHTPPVPEAVAEPPAPEPMPAPERPPMPPPPKSNTMKFVGAAALVVLLFGAAIFLFYIRATQMAEYLDRELARKDTELQDRLEREKKAMHKTLSDHYAMEQASYQEEAKRLETENSSYKERAERLESENRSYQEMVNRLKSERAAYKARIERLESEKNSYKDIVNR